MPSRRQLAAIMFTDIVGYTAMMQHSEQKAVSTVKRHEEILEACLVHHEGEVLHYYGDGSLSIFKSAAEAVKCAMKIQQQYQQSPKVPLRIGIHIGEILFEEGKVYGDGVNIASRIESLGQSGTILFSRHVHEKIRNLSEFQFVSLGEFDFKNVDHPIEVFALANEGFPIPKREEMEGKLKLAPKKMGKKLLTRWILLALSILILVVVGMMYQNSKNQELNLLSAGGISIAVLPFENLTGDPDFEYYAAAMSQELCDRLSKMNNLTTIARRACLRYKTGDRTPIEIAQELKVNYLIDGHLIKSKNEIRISVQLIEGSTGIQLSSYPFTGQLEKVFDAQDDAAFQIAKRLRLDLNPEEISAVKKRYTKNDQAYNTFLKGWLLYESIHADIKPSKEKLDGAKEYFEEAIRQDSLFALAYAGLSAVESFYIYARVPAEYDQNERALSYANKALSLDPNLPEGYMALGELAHVEERHDDAVAFYNKSLDAKQENPIAWCHLSFSCSRIGQDEAATYAASMATKQQPTYVWAHLVLGSALKRQQRYQEAIGTYKYAIQLKPDWDVPYRSTGIVYLEVQDYKNALMAFQKIGQINPDKAPLIEMGFAYAGLGETELAIEAFGKAIENGFKKFDLIESSPHIENIRNDNRFKEFISKYGAQYKD